MKIIANGCTTEVPSNIRLVEFLKSRGQVPSRVVVERNGSALSPSELCKVSLEPGDRLEIVRIVAGG